MTTYLTKYPTKKEFKAAIKSADRMKVFFIDMSHVIPMSGMSLREMMARGEKNWTATNLRRSWFASVEIVQDGYKGLRAKVE